MKKFVSVLLCIGLMMGIVPTVSAAEAVSVVTGITPPTLAAGADVWDGSIQQPTQRVKKGGEDYYELTTCAELAYVAQTGGDWLGYNYILANDLILNDVEITWDAQITWDRDISCTNADQLRRWTPIGDYDHPLEGVFDGNGHIVSGLYVEASADSERYAGLIGCTKRDVANVTVVNSFVKAACGACSVGGVVGGAFGIGGDPSHAVINCAHYGVVVGTAMTVSAGGVVGDGEAIDCVNYGTVVNTMYGAPTGGVTGGYRAMRCVNYGAVTSYGTVGGIAGSGIRVVDCVNYGPVTTGIIGNGNKGFGSAGGIVGCLNGSVESCINYGPVSAKEAAGGIVGGMPDWCSAPMNLGVMLCANFGTVMDSVTAGGIVGEATKGGADTGADTWNVRQCYNIGEVTASAEDGLTGAILCGSTYDEPIERQFANCYYLEGSAPSAFGGGVAASDAVYVAEAKAQDALKQKSTFPNWHFEPYLLMDTIQMPAVWGIDPAVNDGYPYPETLNLPGRSIPVTGVTLDETALRLMGGDVVYLTASVSPDNASRTDCRWTTSDAGVVTVDGRGRLTAVAPGTATVQVTTADGDYAASCTVIVTERREYAYELGEMIFRDSGGNILPAIPDEDFWANVPITKKAAESDATVLLASYDAQGALLRLSMNTVYGLGQGQSVQVGFWVKNDGGVAKLKAFVVSSIGEMRPLCPTIEASR